MGENTQRKIRTNLYFTREFHKLLKEVGGRESNMSVFVEKQLFPYLRAHAHGNPQLKISVYARPEEPSPVKVLCDFLHGATSEGLIHCRKKGVWLQGCGVL